MVATVLRSTPDRLVDSPPCLEALARQVSHRQLKGQETDERAWGNVPFKQQMRNDRIVWTVYLRFTVWINRVQYGVWIGCRIWKDRS